MQVFQPSEPPPSDLSAHVAEVLTAKLPSADPALAQRLLKQLQRVEPAARQALAQTHANEPFEACLKALR